MSADLPAPATVRTLLLDAGGVLIAPDFERVAAALEAQGVPANAEALSAAELAARRQLDRPTAATAGTDEERGWLFFNLLLERAGIPRSPRTDAALIELKTWHDRHNLWSSVLPGVGAALTRLGSGGRRLAVVSNSNGTLRRLLDRLGLLGHFEVVVDSAEEGIEKPDPRLFHLALQRVGARAEEALHVGDLYRTDVLGARAAGVRAVLLDPTGLYPEADCPRVRSLAELARHLAPDPRQGPQNLLDSGSAR